MNWDKLIDYMDRDDYMALKAAIVNAESRWQKREMFVNNVMTGSLEGQVAIHDHYDGRLMFWAELDVVLSTGTVLSCDEDISRSDAYSVEIVRMHTSSPFYAQCAWDQIIVFDQEKDANHIYVDVQEPESR